MSETNQASSPERTAQEYVEKLKIIDTVMLSPWCNLEEAIYLPHFSESIIGSLGQPDPLTSFEPPAALERIPSAMSQRIKCIFNHWFEEAFQSLAELLETPFSNVVMQRFQTIKESTGFLEFSSCYEVLWDGQFSAPFDADSVWGIESFLGLCQRVKDDGEDRNAVSRGISVEAQRFAEYVVTHWSQRSREEVSNKPLSERQLELLRQYYYPSDDLPDETPSKAETPEPIVRLDIDLEAASKAGDCPILLCHNSKIMTPTVEIKGKDTQLGLRHAFGRALVDAACNHGISQSEGIIGSDESRFARPITETLIDRFKLSDFKLLRTTTILDDSRKTHKHALSIRGVRMVPTKRAVEALRKILGQS